MKRLGWEHSEKGWQFCFSDCDVSADDISYREENGNFTLGFESHIQAGPEMRKNDFAQLMDVLRKAPDILYPVFVSNITALLYPIWQHQEQGSVMWIYGEPGSGKTELAMSLGTFVNREKRRSEGQSIFAANGNTRKLVERMQTHNGLNIVVDDVKKERVASQKDKWRKNLDTLIRSVYAQHLTDSFSMKNCNEEIHAGALVTGEIVDLGASSKFRIMFLPIGEFINTEVGIETITSLQEHPDWLVGTMCGIIQFLCRQWNNSGTERYERWFWKLAEKERNLYRRKLASRLGNLSAMESMSHEIVNEYAQSLGVNLDISFECARAVVKETERMLISEADLYESAVTEFLKKLNIQIANVCMDYDGYGELQYMDTGFKVKGNKDALLIEKIATLPGMKMCFGIEAILLVKVKSFCELFESELCAEIETTSYPKHLLLNWAGKLRKKGIILAEPRKDGAYNHIIKYPDQIYGPEKYYVINLQNPIVKRALDISKISEKIEQSETESGYTDFNAKEWEKSDAYKTIKYILQNFSEE